MRWFGICLFVLSVTWALPGCGPATGIKPGMPENVEPPKNFDPGGGVVPDMSGTGAKAKR
jgi:hypothetical protein